MPSVRDVRNAFSSRGRIKTAGIAGATSRGADRLPAAVDLSSYSPPVALQGGDNSCVSWIVGYYMRGWYARRDGRDSSGNARGFAPMYLYSQLSHGRDVTTSFEDNLAVLRDTGVDTRAHYAQGDDNYADAPTASERANAARFAIAGYRVLFQADRQGAKARWAIEQAMAAGNPVGLGIPVYDDFWNADATHYHVDGARGKLYGNHAVFAAGYDRAGVWIENQWGASWGLKGWVRLSWSFIDRYAWEAVTMRVAGGGGVRRPGYRLLPASPAVSSARRTRVGQVDWRTGAPSRARAGNSAGRTTGTRGRSTTQGAPPTNTTTGVTL